MNPHVTIILAFCIRVTKKHYLSLTLSEKFLILTGFFVVLAFCNKIANGFLSTMENALSSTNLIALSASEHGILLFMALPGVFMLPNLNVFLRRKSILNIFQNPLLNSVHLEKESYFFWCAGAVLLNQVILGLISLLALAKVASYFDLDDSILFGGYVHVVPLIVLASSLTMITIALLSTFTVSNVKSFFEQKLLYGLIFIGGIAVLWFIDFLAFVFASWCVSDPTLRLYAGVLTLIVVSFVLMLWAQRLFYANLRSLREFSNKTIKQVLSKEIRLWGFLDFNDNRIPIIIAVKFLLKALSKSYSVLVRLVITGAAVAAALATSASLPPTVRDWFVGLVYWAFSLTLVTSVFQNKIQVVKLFMLVRLSGVEIVISFLGAFALLIAPLTLFLGLTVTVNWLSFHILVIMALFMVASLLFVLIKLRYLTSEQLPPLAYSFLVAVAVQAFQINVILGFAVIVGLTIFFFKRIVQLVRKKELIW